MTWNYFCLFFIMIHNRVASRERLAPHRLLHAGGTRAADPDPGQADARSDQGPVFPRPQKGVSTWCVDGKIVGKGCPCIVGFNDSAGLLDGSHVVAPIGGGRFRCAAADGGLGRAQIGGHRARTRRWPEKGLTFAVRLAQKLFSYNFAPCGPRPILRWFGRRRGLGFQRLVGTGSDRGEVLFANKRYLREPQRRGENAYRYTRQEIILGCTIQWPTHGTAKVPHKTGPPTRRRRRRLQTILFFLPQHVGEAPWMPPAKMDGSGRMNTRG